MRRSHLQVGSLTRWFGQRAPMLLLAGLVGCGVWPTEPPITLLPGDLCSAFPSTAIPTFEDDNMRWAATFAAGLTQQDDLTCGLLAGVTKLFARYNDPESLLGMQNLTNLTLFQTPRGGHAPQENPLDLSPLSGLTRLETVDLYNQSVSDISALAALTNLTFLNLEFNLISDISALSELTNLKELILWGNDISDITPLSGLTSLTTLNLASAWGMGSISDISALSELTNLTELILWRHKITDISALSGLTSLTELNLEGSEIEGSKITDISALSGLTSLWGLNLERHRITDISALSGLTSLTWLSLGENSALSDIEPLLANPGLGAGDYVCLSGTDVSRLDIERLQSKGVTVESDFC